MGTSDGQATLGRTGRLSPICQRQAAEYHEIDALENGLAALRAYPKELAQIRHEIRPSLERSLRGESKPLDVDLLNARVTPACNTFSK